MDLREENRKLLELYEPLRVADVRDGMDWMGYHHYGTLDRDIRPLWRTRACGIARTARYLPFEGPAPLLRGDAYTEWSNNYYNTVATYPWMQEIEDGDMIVLEHERRGCGPDGLGQYAQLPGQRGTWDHNQRRRHPGFG